jgi:hypothetical protein
MYWTGGRDQMIQRMQRARDAGVRGLIATLDWSFSVGRDWGSPEIPERLDLRAQLRMAPQAIRRPQLGAAVRPGRATRPDGGVARLLHGKVATDIGRGLAVELILVRRLHACAMRGRGRAVVPPTLASR